MKKKKLDLHMEDAANERNRRGAGIPWKALASVFIISLAFFFMHYFFSAGASPRLEQIGKIELRVSPSAPVMEGTVLSAQAFSSCGNFSLYLDGSLVGSGERVLQKIAPKAGLHLLAASNEKCNARLQLEITARVCFDGEKKNCQQDGCSGAATCENGRFSSCVLPVQICVPGQRMGCAINGCSFGYMLCNQCGNGYGPCLPKGAPSSAACNSTSCT